MDIGHQFEGDYVCAVFNKAGETKKVFTLEVQIPPTTRMEEKINTTVDCHNGGNDTGP